MGDDNGNDNDSYSGRKDHCNDNTKNDTTAISTPNNKNNSNINCNCNDSTFSDADNGKSNTIAMLWYSVTDLTYAGKSKDFLLIVIKTKAEL